MLDPHRCPDNINRTDECVTDEQCQGQSKCCSDGCRRVCVMPLLTCKFFFFIQKTNSSTYILGIWNAMSHGRERERLAINFLSSCDDIFTTAGHYTNSLAGEKMMRRTSALLSPTMGAHVLSRAGQNKIQISNLIRKEQVTYR